ncbi:MAG: hypothetical protein FWH11_07045 [Micrococcales bacterium]|nr:hypothetical protein [Micrococcales bacterium]
MGHRRYVAFVAPRQPDPADDRRLQAQVDVVRRWWSAPSQTEVLTPVAEPGATTRQALSALADRLTQVRAGATVAVYLTGHGDEGAVSTEYRLRIDGGSYDPATLLEAIWDSDADDALVVLDSCYAYRFAQRAANLYGDRVRQPGRTPPRMVLVVPGLATDRRAAPRFEALTDLLAEALRLVSLDDGHVEPYTPLADERYLTPARLRAALEAAPGELARAGRPGLVRPHVQAFAAEWGDPCSALPNPVYDASAPVVDPATRDLTMSARTIGEYWSASRQTVAPPSVRPGHQPVGGNGGNGLPIVACGSFVVTGKGTGLDRPVIDPQQLFLPRPDYRLSQATGAPAGDPAWDLTARAPVMTPVVQWLAGACTEPLLIVTGARGTGKSTLLGQAVTLADPGFSTRYAALAQAVPAPLVPPAGSVHVAVDARGRTAERVAGLILTALGVAPSGGSDAELESVHERLAQGLRTVSAQRLDGAPVCVVVDSVDESVQPQALVHDVIAALVRTRHPDGRPAARAVVGLRHDRLDDTDLLGLVEALAQGAATHRTVRTDDDAADEVRACCLRLLARPGSPYRDRPDEAAVVADRLAHADQPSFLDARIVAESLSAAATTARVADLGLDGIDAGIDLVGGVLPQALRRALDEQAKTTGRPAATYLAALRALAFARGAGTPWGAVWPTIASAVADDDLGNDVLRELLRGPLAVFTTTASEDGQRVFRPAHATVTDLLRTHPDALVDGLVAEPEETVEARIARRLGALARADGTPDPYLRRHLVAHAAAGGVLTDEIVPVGFLPWETSHDLRRSLRLPLPDGPTTRALAAWAAVEPHLDQIPTLARRRQALRFALLRTPEADAPGSPLGWRTWTAPRNVLTDTAGPVAALAFGPVGGRTLLAGASGHEVRCWDPATGQAVGEPLRGHDGPVLAVAFGQVGGRTLLATGSADGTARIWDPVTGAELGVLSGHAGAVWAVTFGRVAGRPVLATGSADQTAQLWDLALDASLRTWHQPLPHRGAVRAVAFGTVEHQTLLATGCADGTARLWDPVTSQRVDRPLRHGSRVLAVAFGPVGASGSSPLATSSDDGTVQVWNPSNGNLVGRAAHAGLVEAIAFGQVAGRTLLATGGSDRTVRLWDAADLSTEPRVWSSAVPLAPVGAPLRGHGRAVQALTFGQVDRRTVLATGSDDCTLRLWDPAREPTRSTPDQPVPGRTTGPAEGLQSGPTTAPPTFDEIWRQAEIELASSDAPVEDLIGRLLDGISGIGEPEIATTRPHGLPATLPDTPTPPRGAPWADDPTPPRGTQADAGALPLPSRVRVADRTPPHGSPETTPAQGLPQPDADCEPSPDTVVHTVAFGTLSGAQALDGIGPVVGASGGADRTVRLWDPATGRPVGDRLRGHDGPVVAAAFGQAGGRTLLATASDDGTARLWDPASGEPVGRPMVAPVLALAFGRVAGMALLATGGPDRTVRLWAPATGEPVGEPWTGHQGWVRTVAFGQVGDQTLLATGSFDGTARLWDPAGRPLAQLTSHDGPVESVAFGTVDGAPVLATGADDATARLWDPATGELVGVLTGHGGTVQSVAFGTVAGTTVLATAADDRTVRLWDPATGRRVGDPVPVLVRVHDIAFAPDGRLALATAAGTALLAPDLLVPAATL